MDSLSLQMSWTTAKHFVNTLSAVEDQGQDFVLVVKCPYYKSDGCMDVQVSVLEVDSREPVLSI